MTIRFGAFRCGILIATTLAFSHGALADCRETAPRNADADASGVRKVILRTRAGDLTVRGSTSATRLKATGTACSDSQKRLDDIRLDVRRDGDTIHLETVMPESDSFMNSDELDLTVELPGGIEVTLEDSSGDLSVTGVASLRVTDSSGDQSIQDIAGDVAVTDSSGEIDIKNVRGSVKVTDSSGEVLIADVAGDVSIPVDSSGGLVLKRVHGEVHIETDSSGDIAISDVDKDVTIGNDSSGDIRVTDVGGKLTVGNDSSGKIDHRNVLGSVSIPRSQRDDD
jgi:hypothetical protein